MNSPRHLTIRLAVSLGLLVVWTGCASHGDRFEQIRHPFHAGQLEAAADEVARQLEKHPADADVLRLEAALIELCAGRPQDAERLLRTSRDSFDRLDQAGLPEQAWSMLTDDTRRAYAGESYEQILIRAMLALSSLVGDGQDAYAYSLQIGEKQQQWIDRLAASRKAMTAAEPDSADPSPPATDDSLPPVEMGIERVALGAYLQAVIREETHLHYDDAARAMARVVAWQPQFASGPFHLARVRAGRHSAPGHGVVHVFALTGRGPYKVQGVEAPTTAALFLADQILSQTTGQSLPPTVAPVKVPRLVVDPGPVRAVQVRVEGGQPVETETLTDVSLIAAQQHEAQLPSVVARAVVRRLMKKGIVAAGKNQAGVAAKDQSNVLLDLVGIAWEATEAADTRCWGLLPDRIQVARLELPVGRHQLQLIPVGNDTACGPPVTVEVDVVDGRNRYLLACFPNGPLVGKVVGANP